MFSWFARRSKTAHVRAGTAAVSALALGAAAMNLAAKSPVSPAAVAADPQVQKIAIANTDFGFRLLKQLARETPGQNVFYSPFSVSSALTLTLNGAGGATHKDMSAALGLSGLTTDQTDHAYGLLLPSLENPDLQVTLTVANALWANRGTTFNSKYQQESQRFFGARVQTLDMTSPEAAATINGWVSGKTHGKIDKLVTPADIAASPAVLTNAVYFHGKWSEPFEKSNTEDGPFTLASGKTKTLPLMSQEASFSYAETPRFQVVSLPYGQGRTSLYVLLPRPGVKAVDLVSSLDPASFKTTLAKMQLAPVALTLPRFKVNYSATLNAPLTALGMGNAFGGGADFAPMGLHGGFIGAVIHKAVLEVDEQGTVAAAATGVMMAGAAAPSPVKPIVMRVNHPFVCLLRDNTTGTLLFAGVIQNPK